MIDTALRAIGNERPYSVRRRRTGVALACVGVAVASLAVAALEPLAPVVSLGVLYVLPVLLASVVAGLAYGILAALLSTLAFNWLFLAPRGTLTITDGRHWVAVAVFLVVAVVGARITEAARTAAARAEGARRDADLIAGLASVVLGATPGTDAIAESERRLAEHLGATTRIVPTATPSSPNRVFPLDGPSGTVGWLAVDGDLPGRVVRAIEERIAPALGALLAAAAERERHAREAIDVAAVRRSDELKTTLLRSVGHDLRTPLTQISASASALTGAPLEDAERRELAFAVVDGSERLAAMVEKLLDLARIEGGSAAPRRTAVALDDVVRDALGELGAAQDRIRLEVQTPVPDVEIDPVQLSRALINVLENALVHGKGSGPDGGLVLVRVARRRDRGTIRVVDRGGGIPSTDRERVLAPFERGHETVGGGSGLGLAIARGFVEANGGRIALEGYPGQGTAVAIDLPLAESKPPASACPSNVAASPSDAVSGADR